MIFNFKQLRFIRKQKNYTLESLAKATGIPYQKLSNIETGSVIPKPIDIEKLEKVLCIEIFKLTTDDHKILNLFDDFYSILFYGNLNTVTIKKRVDVFFDETLNSKYYYLVYLMKYIYEVLADNDNLLDARPLDDIDFDQRAYHIYLIYKGVQLYESKKIKQAEEVINTVINQTLDERILCLASYQLLFALTGLSKLDTASLTVNKTRQTFAQFGAYIRVYECDLLQASIFVYQRRFEHAIEKYKNCIESALSMELPKSEINFVYRNIALTHIYNHSYDQALFYLDEAYSRESKNENIIMYYLYVYYFTSDLKNYDIYLKKAKSIIIDSSYLKELDFWVAIGKNKFYPTKNALNKAIKVYEYYDKFHKYEMTIFFLDIIISLFEQINDEKNVIFYLKIHKNLLIQTQNS